MIVTTSGQIEDKSIIKTIGLVKGSTIRARHVGRDIMAGLRGLVGGDARVVLYQIMAFRIKPKEPITSGCY